jgi:uncharacterized Zn finger protein
MARKRRRSYYDDYWPRFESTRPIEVAGGIKAKSQHGQFAKQWWANRWIAALTSLMDSGRLSRGRSYARRGQVIEIDLQPSRVTALVQGSRPKPYKINIRLQPLTDVQWNTVLDALAEQAIFAAQLLAGEMPADIEQVFAKVKVPLFPSSRGDLRTECTCPDWANPCKHVAAVYYLLGERFDEDPFLLLELRGRNKEQIAAALRERRTQVVDVADAASTFVAEADESVEVPALETSLDHYWALAPKADRVELDVSAPAVEVALLKRLGVPAFLGAREVWKALGQAYERVTARALEAAYADIGDQAIADSDLTNDLTGFPEPVRSSADV